MAKVGRPQKYETAAELEKIVKAYFAECNPHWVTETTYEYPWFEGEEGRRRDHSQPQVKVKRRVLTEQKPYTMSGLALRLGLSRQGLKEYKDKGDEFSDTILWARSVVQEFNEHLLLSGRNAAGAIFNLRVNFGFHDDEDDDPPPENKIVFINTVPVPPDEHTN